MSATAQSLTAGSLGADLQVIIDRAVKDGIVPAVSVSVIKENKVLAERASGIASRDTEKSVDNFASPFTVFDLGELTQALITVPLLLILVGEGRVDLNHRVSRYLPSFNVLGKSGVTIGHLLSHTSGLASGVSFFESLRADHGVSGLGNFSGRGSRDYILNSIMRAGLKNPLETKCHYSEVGFIVLGNIIELLTGSSFEKAAQKYILQPLGLRSTSFIDVSLLRRRKLQVVNDMIASTDICSRRERICWGEVFDETAWIMGGISGHGGLFGTASDVAKIFAEVGSGFNGRSNLFNKSAVKTFVDGGSFAVPTPYHFGWDTPTRENGLYDVGLSSQSVGMTGGTGCFVWVEPETTLSIAILTNKIDVSRTSRKLQSLRNEIIRAIKTAY